MTIKGQRAGPKTIPESLPWPLLVGSALEIKSQLMARTYKYFTGSVLMLLLVAACWDDGRTLWLENDTDQAIIIHGTGDLRHRLEPGAALDVGTTSSTGVDEFTGEIDGRLITIVIEGGAIEEYLDPERERHFRIPLSRFISTN